MPVALAVVLALAAADPPAPSEAAPSASSPRTFRCDGTDPFFFEELNNAGTVGYGETWDETICDEGIAIYAESTKSQWEPFKRKRVRLSANDSLLAFAVPTVVFGGIAGMFAIAGLLALVTRFKRRVVLDVRCPSCSSSLPITPEDGSAMFCPVCGAACSVEIRGKGRTATAVARPL